VLLNVARFGGHLIIVAQLGRKRETEEITILELNITKQLKKCPHGLTLQKFFDRVQFAVFAGIEERDVRIGALIAEINFATVEGL